jgi:hypothetical protein
MERPLSASCFSASVPARIRAAPARVAPLLLLAYSILPV